MCNDYICNGGKLYNIITNDEIKWLDTILYCITTLLESLEELVIIIDRMQSYKFIRKSQDGKNILKYS